MKTRLYTRKRALISSVAMLLVAMIALGTATFAWFTSRPDANAQGLTLKATATNGLVILTESHENYIKSLDNGTRQVKASDWVHDDFLNYTNNGTTASSSTTPVLLDSTSFNLGLNSNVFSDAYRVTAKEDNNYVAANDAPVSKITDRTGLYQETIKCKVTGAIDSTKDYKVRVSGLTAKTATGLTTEGADLLKSARIALEYSEKGAAYTNIGVYSFVNTTSNQYLKNGGESVVYSAAVSTKPDPAHEGQVLPLNYEFNKLATANVNVENGPEGAKYQGYRAGTVGTSGADSFRLTIYLDGEDTNCKTSNYDAAALLSEVKLNLVLDTLDK